MAFIRTTKQREAIQTAFLDTDRPLKPDEALARAARQVPTLGIATVYRTINKLLEEGWLEVVEIPGEPPRYEVAGKHHHHHFLCTKCEKMFELDGCSGNLSSLLPDGFSLHRHHLTLFGCCKDCR